MQPDPTIERVRRIRHEISEQCDHDPKKLVEYYRKYQQKFSGRLIRKPKTVRNFDRITLPTRRRAGRINVIRKIEN